MYKSTKKSYCKTNIKQISILAGLLINLCTTNFAAQSMDLLDSLKVLEENNLDLQIVSAIHGSGAAATMQATLQALPRITTSYYDDYKYDNDGKSWGKDPLYDYRRGMNLSAGYTFNGDSLVKFSAAYNVARTTQLNYQYNMQEVLKTLLEKYFTLIMRDIELKSSVSALAAYAKLLDDAQHKFEAGLLTKADVLSAAAEYDNEQAQQLENENNYKYTLDDFLSYLYGNNTHVDYKIKLASLNEKNEDVAFKLPSMDDLVEQYLHKNLKIKLKRNEIADARNSLMSSYSGYLPDFSVNYSHNLNNGGPSWTTSLRWSLDSYTVISETAQKAQVFKKNRRQLDSLILETKNDLQNIYRQVKTAHNNINIKKKALASAKLALEATEVEYDLGAKTMSDILSAQAKAIAAEREHKKAKYIYLLKYVELQSKAGNVNLALVKEINYLLSEEELNMVNNTLSNNTELDSDIKNAINIK